jgi:hypothetical protein
VKEIRAVKMQVRTMEELAEAKSKVAHFRWLSFVKSAKAKQKEEWCGMYSKKLKEKRDEMAELRESIKVRDTKVNDLVEKMRARKTPEVLSSGRVVNWGSGQVQMHKFDRNTIHILD